MVSSASILPAWISSLATSEERDSKSAADDTPAAAEDGSEDDGRIDFETQVRPILQSKCQPCHFEGGKMHRRLPFDQPETIVKLDRKLYKRLKDPEQQEVIKAFIAQAVADGEGDPGIL